MKEYKKIRKIRFSCPNRNCRKNFLTTIYEGQKNGKLIKCPKCGSAIRFDPKDKEKGFQVEKWKGHEVIACASTVMTCSIDEGYIIGKELE